MFLTGRQMVSLQIVLQDLVDDSVIIEQIPQTKDLWFIQRNDTHKAYGYIMPDGEIDWWMKEGYGRL